MKNIKSILVATALISATLVSGLSAQEAAEPAQKHEFHLAIGDSVMIKRECQKYLTGERPSTWVWDKVHTVRQLGTKRNPNQFPDGVLLMNIYSWMCEDCLINVNGRAEEAAAKAASEQAEEREAWEQAQKAGEDPEAAAAAAAAEKAAREAAELAAQEAAAKAEADRLAREAEEAAAKKAKQDSVKHEEKFKYTYDRFTIGLRGGAASLLHQADKANWNCGGAVVLDLQYAHYWARDGRPLDLGIITGVGIGYSQSSLFMKGDSTAFTNANVNYTVKVQDVREVDHTIQLEIPLMFSLIHENGLFFNVGPKFMMPVYSPYRQTANQEQTHISAYFPEYGITVIDQEVTGKYTGQQPTSSNGIQFNVNVMLTAEIGYEWSLRNGDSFGLGAYANYSLYNSYKNATSTAGLFNLTAPTDDDKANLDVLSATHTYAAKMGYFDVGVKLAYHFNFPKKKLYNSVLF